MLKVGDRVRIKTEREFIKEFGVDWRMEFLYYFVPEMECNLGKVVTIEIVIDEDTVENVYTIEKDYHELFYTNKMFAEKQYNNSHITLKRKEKWYIWK